MEDSEYNIKLVRAFAEKARTDLKAAETLIDSMDYANAAYLAQQASEKVTKCVLIINKKFERAHLVSGLLEEIVESLEEEWKSKLQDLVPILKDLERHWVLPRYPEPFGEKVWNPVEEYKLEDARDAIEKAKLVLETLTKFIEEYYHIEL